MPFEMIRRPGEKHPNASLTNKQAKEIRKQRAMGRPVGQLAREAKVSEKTIYRLLARETYWEP